jgi:hypothetical protein
VRSLTAGAVTALGSASVPLVLLVEMAFSPVIYLASSAVDIVWDSKTWLGAGSLGAVEPVRDRSGDGGGLQFTLSGVPSAAVSLALGTSVRNRSCILRAAILNPTTHAVEDVATVGTFKMDQMTIAGGTIGVTAYPMSRIFARPKPLRYTDGDQQLVSSGDRALEFLVSQANKQDVWPAASWFRR